MDRRRISLGAALLVVVTCSLQAQTEAAQLPAPLVAALLAGNRLGMPLGGPNAAARYYVAAPPPGWPAALIPRSASPVGGMTSGPQLIAVFADTTRRFLASYLKQLEDSGWVQPVIESGNGFQSSSAGRYAFYCRDSARVSAIAVPGAATGAFIHVTYQRSDPSACTRRVVRPQLSELVLPTLAPPPGATVPRAGSQGDASQIGASAHLVNTTLAPAEVVQHYVTQLIAAGWTADAPASNASLSAVTLHARDKDGKPWTGWLLVVNAGTGKDVTLDMRRVDAP